MSTSVRPCAPASRTTQLIGQLTTFWRDLDEPVTARRVPGTVPVFLIGAAAALLAAAFVVPSGFNLAYADAQSHLTIARRILDTSSTPGLRQLGTVWLPVPHLLLVPLTASAWLWHTGWGAAILGAGCLGTTCAGLYRVLARWGAGRAARVVALAVVISNPTMLYLCTTALTEPVLIASMAACLAGLANYATRSRLSSPGELAIFAGIPAALAALSRYEGWALCLTGAAFVLVVARRRSGQWGTVLAAIVGFLAPPVLAIGWWLGYNWVVFHHPLEFFNGQFSANAQQAEIVAQGASTASSLRASLAALDAAVLSSAGPVCLVLGTIGVVWLIARRRSLTGGSFLVTAATSYLFLVVALYAGQAIIWNQATGASYMWNNRFGMATIVPISLLAAAATQGALAHLRPPSWSTDLQRTLRTAVVGAVVVALGAQAVWFLQCPAERSLVIAEASASWTSGAPSREAGTWLRQHYDGGQVLLDETGSANAHLPWIGLPLSQYYLQADGELFQQVLADPAAHARWVWTSSSTADVVSPLTRSPGFQQAYERVFSNGTITIYRRIDR